MGWINDYLIKPIDHQGFSMKYIRRTIETFFVLLWHSLWPHKEPQQPNKELPQLQRVDDTTFKLCEKIYDSSLERIEILEKKAFYLLSYITAISTIVAFASVQFSNRSDSFLYLIPAVFLLLTFVISFRCLRIKSIHELFIDDIYHFETPDDDDIDPKGWHSRSFLSAAVHNQANADNTADMLRVARMLLALTLFSLIGTTLYILSFSEKPVSSEAVNSTRQTSSLESIDSSLIGISNDISLLTRGTQAREEINNDLRVIRMRLDSLAKEVRILQSWRQRTSSRPQNR